jgi:hypothetical protein
VITGGSPLGMNRVGMFWDGYSILTTSYYSLLSLVPSCTPMLELKRGQHPLTIDICRYALTTPSTWQPEPRSGITLLSLGPSALSN